MRWRFWSRLIAILGVVLHAGIVARHNAFALGRAGQPLVGAAAVFEAARPAGGGDAREAAGQSQAVVALGEALLHSICSAARDRRDGEPRQSSASPKLPSGNPPYERSACPVCAGHCPSTATLSPIDAVTERLMPRRATILFVRSFDTSTAAGHWSLKPPGRGPPQV